ncbi:MAG: amino acid ABC transporter permease, partial [Proteobacteria bacterium]
MKEIFVSVFGKPFGIVLFQLLEATQFTIYLSLFAFFGGGAIGIVIALLRIYPSQKSRAGAVAYIWLFQSVPLLMLLFLFGLGIPRLFGQNVDPWIAAIGALTLYTSAYLADVWRGSVEAVPKGQWEGARALGLGFFKTLQLVIAPQAIRNTLAPTVGFMVQIIKGTSLAFIIGFHDL